MGRVSVFAVRNASAQAIADLVEHDEEVGIQVAEHGALERLHHFGERVRRAGPEQQSFGVSHAPKLRDRTGDAVEDVGFRDQHLVESPVPHHRHDHDHAAHDHVDAALLESGVVAALRDRLGRERAEDLLGRGRVNRK